MAMSNDYIDFYTKNLLIVAKANGIISQDMILNDISLFNEDVVLSNLKAFNVSEPEFYNKVRTEEFGLSALWKLSAYLFNYVMCFPVCISQIRAVDEYLDLLTSQLKGMDIEKITFTVKAKGESKARHIIFNKIELIDTICKHLFAKPTLDTIVTDEARKDYQFGEYDIAGNILSKRNLNWLFAQELTRFILAYKKLENMSDKEKQLVMDILFAFNRYSQPQLSVDYNKLFSDAKKGRMETLYYNLDSIFCINNSIQPFALVKHPETVRIAQEYEKEASNV